MAQMISALIYNINGNDQTTPATYGFPVANCLIRPAGIATAGSGSTTMNATIQVLASGSAVKQGQYHTNSTVSTLVTAANA